MVKKSNDTVTRVDLTELQHKLIWNLLGSLGAILVTGEHEGSTLSKEGIHLCQADGAFWVLLEGDIKVSDVVQSPVHNPESLECTCPNCGNDCSGECHSVNHDIDSY